MTASISVVIPTYNRAHLVPRAVASALRATDPGDEVLVVDDGSSDGTEAALSAFSDRIRYLRIPNGGAGRARNIGIAASRNPLIAFLDSDDEWMDDKLRLQRRLMEARADILYCFTDFAVRYQSGDVERRYLINWHHDARGWDQILGTGVEFSSIAPLPDGRPDFRVHVGDLFASQMAALYVFTSSLVVRRASAGEALRFAEDLPIYEDWECYGRLARAGAGAFLDCETVWNHGHRGTRLTDAKSFDRVNARIRVLERVWGADAGFMAVHGEQYRMVLGEQRLLRVKDLIWEGSTRAARVELKSVENAPLSCKVMAAMPGAFARGILRLRHVTRHTRPS